MSTPALINWPALYAEATRMAANAYAPYSHLHVGAAALVDDGRVVSGCNVENASYGLTLCAECGLVSALHASGGGRLVAVVCVDAGGDHVPPCGRCRQLLLEAGGPALLVGWHPQPLPIAELLPHAFGPRDPGGAGAS
jgi:cytidine deaminase